MLEFLRTIRQNGDIAVKLPGLLLAFFVAEFFYKFHSFSLECGAFLITWLLIDLAIERIAKWNRQPRADDAH